MAKRKSRSGLAVPQIAGISRICISGFKSISQETAVEVRPLTVLAGPNSSGKSSQMQPLLLLKQTLEAQYDPGSLLIDGAHVKFTSTNQFLSRSMASKEPINTMTIKVDVGDESTKLSFSKGDDGPIEVKEMTRTGMVMAESGKPSLRNWKIRANDSSDDLRKTFQGLKAHHPFIEEKRAKFSVVRERCFLSATASIHFDQGGATGSYYYCVTK